MNFQAICKKITYRKIALAMLGLFLISLLPILYCSFFDYANGDDLWEGAAAYRVLVNNGTLKDFLTAVFEWAKEDYLSWEGNWSSIILWCLEPSIWGEKVYCITPWIALFSLCGGTTYFLFHYLKKYLNVDFIYLTITSVLTCFFIIQYMPNVKNGVFWYTGMVNYIVPFGLCLISFVWVDKFLETGKKRYLVFATLAFTYVSGAGYTPIVLAFEVLFLVMLLYMLCRDAGKRHRARWISLPIIFLIIGFVFSAISPGNAVRGGESYYFDVMRIFTTILECIRLGFVGIFKWFITIRPLILIVPLLAVMTWEQIDIGKTELEFKHPILVIVILFLISCSLYAPGIYAQSEVSGGVPDTIYFVFLLTYILSVIYLTCYLKKIGTRKGWKLLNVSFTEKLRGAIVLGELLFCLVAARHLIGNMSAYICFDFINSGQLRDFEYQMQERLRILHDPEITDVVLPEMNDEQGPFMHMALLADPKAYTNKATARFYGKDTVIAIPRTEYYELYGYPEEIQ